MDEERKIITINTLKPCPERCNLDLSNTTKNTNNQTTHNTYPLVDGPRYVLGNGMGEPMGAQRSTHTLIHDGFNSLTHGP